MYGFQEPAKFDGNGNGEIACSSKILIQSTYIKVAIVVLLFLLLQMLVLIKFV